MFLCKIINSCISFKSLIQHILFQTSLRKLLTWQTQQFDLAPRQGTDQSWQPLGLIRVFAVHSGWSLGSNLSPCTQQEVLSYWVDDVKAARSYRWVQREIFDRYTKAHLLRWPLEVPVDQKVKINTNIQCKIVNNFLPIIFSICFGYFKELSPWEIKNTIFYAL